jgi:hypothetical protein
MIKNKVAFLLTVILAVILNFEFRTVRELNRTHFGWYCFLSIDLNRPSEKRSGGYFDKEFSNVFINSEQIDEIRNQITDILEREDENYESDSEDTVGRPDISSDI